MALLDEMARQLIAQAVGVAGTTASWSVFKGWEPETPDQSISIFETGGRENQPHDDSLYGMLDFPTFQVRVRGAGQDFSTGYPAARAKIAAARTALERLSPGTVLGRYYCQVTANGEPISLGHDASHRPRFTLNFTALRSRSS